MLRWLATTECAPPHRVTDWDKCYALRDGLKETGWRHDCPVLLGYPFEGTVQLISGSHRWAAARLLERSCPVWVLPYETVAELWGTEAWVELVAQPPTLGEVTHG